MSFEWNHEQVEKPIETYRDKPELWDPKSNNYHIRNKKHDAWVLIAENIGCSIVEAKTKMTSLLSSYRREKVKMKESIGTGKGRDEIFVSTWFAFKYFEFWKEKDAPINRINTEEPDNGNDIGNVSDEEDLEHELNRIIESQENPRNLGTEEAAENSVQNPDPTTEMVRLNGKFLLLQAGKMQNKREKKISG